MKTFALNTGLADAVVKVILAAGAKDAVVSPGSRNTPLVLALRRAADAGLLTLHTIIDERAAAFVAIGLARVTGSPTVLSCTSGSAGAHYLPAVVEANLSRLPVIVVTADRPLELQDCGAPQTMRQKRMFGEHVRAAVHLEAPASKQDVVDHVNSVREACRIFCSTATGPVHINMAFREPLWKPGEDASGDTIGGESLALCMEELPRTETHENFSVAEGHDEAFASLVGRACEARRGLIVWGAGEIGTGGVDYDTGRRRLAQQVSTLAERAGWPIISDATSGIRDLPHLTRLHIGTADVILRCSAACETLEPDFVIRVGGEPTSKVVSRWLHDKARGKVMLIDPSGWLRDPGRTAATLVSGDPSDVLSRLGRALDERYTRCSPNWTEGWLSANERAIYAVTNACQGTSLWAGSVAKTVSQELPSGTLLHLASSLSIRSFVSFVPATPSGMVLTANRGVNGIDGTLSTALGQGRRWTKGPTAVLMGDVAFAHDASALANVQENQAFVVVVVDNGGGGIFDHLPVSGAGQVFEDQFITRPALDIEAIASAYGLSTQRVCSVDELRMALRQAVTAPGPYLIVAEVNRETDYQLHQSTWAGMSSARPGGIA